MKTYILFILAVLFLPLSHNNAQIQFTEIGVASGVNFQPFIPYYIGGGAAFFDYNNDGKLDIYITGGFRKDKLYRNNGNGTFTDVSTASGISGPSAFYVTNGVTTGDIDNDGDRDILVSTERSFPNRLFRNNGNGTFTDITVPAGMNSNVYSSHTASFGDYNKDGKLDISISHYVEQAVGLYDSLGTHIGFLHKCPLNSLYLNNGNNTFTNVAATVGITDTACTLSTAFTDFDSDGDMDIANANDFGQWIIENQLFRNNYPANNFTSFGDSVQMNTHMYGMGIAIGDYDQDLDLDYYMTNIGRNSLYRNMGAAGFIDTADAAGVDNTYTPGDTLWTTSWGTGFMDIDNDSYLELFVSNGYVYSTTFIINDEQDPNALFYNNGDGTFTDIAPSLGLDEPEIFHGFTYGDIDNDGDLDMLATILVYDTLLPNQSNSKLYRNDSDTSNHWLQIELEGVQTNRDAYGCQIEIHLGTRHWLHEISGGASHSSQYSSIAHFGLASDTLVDSLVIHWLNSPAETYYNLPANRRLHLIEGTAPPPPPTPTPGDTSAYPYPIRAAVDSLTILPPPVPPTPNDTSAYPYPIKADPDSLSISSSAVATYPIEIYQTPKLLLFPNPAQDICYMQYEADSDKDVPLQVYNNLGQLMDVRSFSGKAGSQRQAFSLQGFLPGIYHFVLFIDGKRYTKQLIVK